jgi:lipopolysaccharide biosynthesis glycosyltransferase
MNDRISISFAATDNFSQHLAVVMASILVNNRKDQFIFHILHRNISKANQKRIGSISERYANCEIKFHQVDGEAFKDAPLPSPHISVESYFRLLLPKILIDEDRTLYLDVDILCRSGIREFWEVDLDGFACAAVGEEHYPANSLLCSAAPAPEGKQEYFNAGVMLFNLDFIRKSGLDEKPFSILREWKEKIGYADQDVLNLAYHGKVMFVSRRYNFTGKWGTREKPSCIVIRHFASFSQKPWNCKLMRFTWIAYARYLALSPYSNNLVGFILKHLRSLLYWKYSKNGRPCLDIFGIKVWHGRYSWKR